jgi:YegS/Rv2252/BmrU family lipid kinase
VSPVEPAPRPLDLVVNPAAGGGRALRSLAAVEAALHRAGHDLTVTLTRDLDHAAELAAQAGAADRVAVAFGGDGLVGRMAGAVAAGGGTLGVLPGGRGNDFARALGISRHPVAACRVLAEGTAARVDLGEVGGRSFVGIASLGFDSVVQEIAHSTRLPLGRLVYVYGTLRGVIGWRPATYSLRLDDREVELTGWSVAVANSGVYGGGMRMAPEASLVDGLLDVVTTSRTGRLTLLSVLPRVFSGTHVRHPMVAVQRAEVVGVCSDRPFRVFADGDPVGETPCEIRIRAGVLEVLAPAAFSAAAGLREA